MTNGRNYILVDALASHGVLKSPHIIEAFRNIDRGDFVSSEYAELAYEDMALPVGSGQTISQPWTVAFMFELLSPQKGDTILDVGSGSGWTTALLAAISGENGDVIGLERIPELVAFGQSNLAKYHFSNTKILLSQKFDPSRYGPFEKILVSASAENIPESLVDILAKGGAMVIPVRSSILKITKNAQGELAQEEFPGFAFVPYIE